MNNTDTYYEFLRANLSNGKEFALIALPAEKSSTRIFYNFTRKGENLVDSKGNRLTLCPFVASESVGSDGVADEKAYYITATKKAIQHIQAGKMKKVVLARTKRVEHITKNFLSDWYMRLLKKYPESFIFILSTKESGIWVGASPELLVKKSGVHFHTRALAGTSKSLSPQWSPKDYTEHQLVVSYIQQELKKLNIEDLSMRGPYNFYYGPIVHLKTDISFSSSLSLRGVVSLLQPTPALCGYPKEEALDFIKLNEASPRKFYTGCMTIEDVNGDGVAFAFLRCGRLSGSTLTVYAGCGIVASSDPENEWEESEAKIASILIF